MPESVSNLTIPYDELANSLRIASSDAQLYQAIANAPFEYPAETAQLFLSFITFCLVDELRHELFLAGTSDTEGYRLSIQGYDFDPASYRIPLDDPKSTLIKAISSGRPQTTKDWSSLSRPEASEETVRLNQATSGITYSEVYSLSGKVRGTLMYNFIQYQGSIGPEQREFMERYTALVTTELDSRD